MKYVCSVCGYIYDPQEGAPDAGVAAGTAWENAPDDFVCPLCGVGKDHMTREKAIDLVKNDLKECDSNVLSNVSEYIATKALDGCWNVSCHFKQPMATPIGQRYSSIDYIVKNDGSVLCPPI